MDGERSTKNPGLDLSPQGKESLISIGENQMFIFSELYPIIVTYNNSIINTKGAIYVDDQLDYNNDGNIMYEDKWSLNIPNVKSICFIEDIETCTLVVLQSNTIELYNAANGNLLKSFDLEGNPTKVISSPDIAPTFCVLIDSNLYSISIKKINEKKLLNKNVTSVCTTAQGKIASVSNGKIVSIMQETNIITKFETSDTITHIFPYQFKNTNNVEGILIVFQSNESTTLKLGYITLDKNQLKTIEFSNFFEGDEDRDIIGASSPHLPYVLLSPIKADQAKIITYYNNTFQYFTLEGEVDNRFERRERTSCYQILYRSSKEDEEQHYTPSIIIGTRGGCVSERGINTSPANIPFDRTDGQLSILDIKKAVIMGDIKKAQLFKGKIFTLRSSTEVVLHQSGNTLTAIAEGSNMYAVSNRKKVVIGFYDDEFQNVFDISNSTSLKFISTPSTIFLVIGTAGSLKFVNTETMEVVREWTCELEIPITKIDYIPECFPYIYFYMGGTVFRYSLANHIADEVYAGCYSFALFKQKSELLLAYILPECVRLSNGSQFLCLFSEKTAIYGTPTGTLLVYDPESSLGDPMLYVGDGQKFESYKMKSANIKIMPSSHSNLVAFSDGTNAPLLASIKDDFSLTWANSSLRKVDSELSIDAVYLDFAKRESLSILYITEKNQTFVKRYNVSNDFNMISFVTQQGIIKDSDAYRIQQLKRINIGPTYDGSVSSSESLPLIAACTSSEVKVLRFSGYFASHYQYPFRDGIATCFTRNYIVAASEHQILILDTEIKMKDYRYIIDFEYRITRLISNDAFYPFCAIIFEDGTDDFMKVGTINVETLERRMLVKGGAFASVANTSTMSDEALEHIGGNTLIPFDDFAVSYAGTPIGLTNSFVIAYKATGPEVLGYLDGADTLIPTYDAVFIANTSPDDCVQMKAITADGPTDVFEFPQTLSYLCSGVGCSRGIFINDDGTLRSFIINDENKIIEIKSSKQIGLAQDASRIASLRSDSSVFVVAQLENGFIQTYSTPLEPEDFDNENEEEDQYKPRGLEVIRNFKISIRALGDTEMEFEEVESVDLQKVARSLEKHPNDQPRSIKPVFRKYTRLFEPKPNIDPFLSKRIEMEYKTQRERINEDNNFETGRIPAKPKVVSKNDVIKMRRYFGK